jgi:F420-dependent oxidoreductase-like protein
MARIKWGFQTSPQHVSFGEILGFWQRADALGYDSGWLFDHFLPIFSDPTGVCYEGWTLLATLAAKTNRLHVGCLVTSIIYRHPALLANMGATLDVASGGRLEMGIGAGWFEEEARAYGMPFPPTGERLKRLNEGVQVLRALWTQEISDFAGEFYTLSNARCNPKPIQKPTPPIWIGGQGEKVTLRIVAQHADGWDMDLAPLGDYTRKLGILAEHCQNHGRDPNTIKKMIHFPAIIGENQRDISARAETWAKSWNTSPEELRTRVLIGTPEEAAAWLLPYAQLGVEHFVMNITAPYDIRMAELFIEEVAPAVNKAAGR